MKIDEAIEHHNKANEGLKIDRIKLGKMVFPHLADSTINSRLSQWQRDIYETKPTPEQSRKIADILGVSLDFLYGRTINPNKK